MEITIEKWEEIKLKLAVAGALIFGGLSILFSMLGLSFSTAEASWAWLVGLFMAMGITIIQLVGNTAGKKDTIFVVIWMASYAYGITANVIGITGLMSEINPIFMYLIAVPMGILIEIVPEKLLIISLGGDLRKSANSISTMFTKKPTPRKPPQTSPAMKKYVPQHRPISSTGGYKPTYARPDLTDPMSPLKFDD
jgi:hypothetical protein